MIGVVLVPCSALAFALTSEKQYAATAKLLFRDPGFDQKLFGSTVLGPSQDPSREAATNVGLVSLDNISARAARTLDNPLLTASKIRKKVEVTAQGQSDVVSVKATDTSPRLAAKLANTIAEQYIAFRRDADRAKILQAVSLVRRQLDTLSPQERAGSGGRAVSRQMEQLRTLASLQTGNAELVQRANRPRTPSSPKPVRAAILGLIAGLVLAIGLAIVLERLDRRLRSRGDAEMMLGRPVLGSVPDSRVLQKSTGDLYLAGLEAESFRTLRTNLRYFDVDKHVHSLLITSSAPGDGKSTVSRYLAATAAASHVRVVLVEADLRRPTLAKLLDLHESGLTDVLTDQASLEQVIQQVAVDDMDEHGEGPTLDVVTAGHIPPNPSDLLESHRMRDVLTELERSYELVIVDTSPVTVVADAIPLMSRVSGVAIVIREGKSMKGEARKLRKQLDNLRISPLGIIVNAAAPVMDGAYYAYYGYSSHKGGSGSSKGGKGASSNAAEPLSRRSRRRQKKAAAKRKKVAASR